MKPVAVTALLVSSFIPCYSAMANEESDSSLNRIKLSMGSYIISRAETTFALNERDLGLGLSIDPHESLGTDLEQSVFRLDAAYRFSHNHSIHLSWYEISNRGKKAAETDFEWVDQDGNEYLIESGSEIVSELGYNIIKASYRWTFYNNDKVELFTSAGLHFSEFEVDVEVTSTVTGSTPESSARDVDSAIPLPVIGLGARYHFATQWSWYLKSEFFTLNYDDWNGTYSDTMFGIEYTPFKHFGAAVGIGSSNLNVMEETEDYRFTYDNRITGLTLQLTTLF